MGKAFSKSVSPNKAEPAATQPKPAEAPAPTQQVEASVAPPVQEAAVPEKPAVVEEPVAAEPVVESVPEPEPEAEVLAAIVSVVEDVPPEVPTAPLPVEKEVVVPEPVKEVLALAEAEAELIVAVSEPEPPAPEPVVELEPEPEPVPEPEVILVAPEPVVEPEPEPEPEPVDLLAQESVPLSAPLVDLAVADIAATAAFDTPLISTDLASPLEPTDVLGDEVCQDLIEEAIVNSVASPEEPEESTVVAAALASEIMENVEQPLCDVVQEVSDGPLKHLDLTGNGFMNDLIPNDVQIPDDIPIADVSLSNELM